MHNFKLTIAYDGTDFHGWQIQPGQPTIQGALTEVLRRITQEELTLDAAGRTDAGVHARGQVASFKTHAELAAEEYQRALNAMLPAAIRIREAEEMGPDFHARWMAEAKTYQYRIYRGRVVPPFRWRYVLHDAWPLDFAAMAEAAQCFEGEHDFTSFAASTGSEEEDRNRVTVRSVYRSELVRTGGDGGAGEELNFAGEPARCGEEWVYVIRGKSFLRHMVRKIVGTLLEVGRGRLAPQEIAPLFALRDRSRSGPTAPPQGLCLQSVEYPDPTASLERAIPGGRR
jgi:tRNA pseudouridine38-40 synthase